MAATGRGGQRMTSLREYLLNPPPRRDNEPEWLRRQRALAAERLAATGLPAAGSENWRYAPLRALLARNCSTAGGGKLNTGDLLELAGLSGQEHRLVFVDGIYQPGLSRPPPALEIRNLPEALGQPLIQEALRELPEADDRGFSWLNSRDFREGLYLDCQQSLDEPLHFLHIGQGATASSRHFIRLRSGARLRISEQFLSATREGSPGLINNWTQVVVGQDARLDWARLQRLAAREVLIDRLDARLEQAACLEITHLDSGGQFARHDIDVSLEGERARVRINGGQVLRGRQHGDFHTRIDHRAGNCVSREHFKYVAGDRARGVYNGRIIVHPGADGTDSAQKSASLLLSPQAEIDTKPDLEIYTDDVIASHGATVGQLDEQALFYLRSRGLDEASARRLLMRAFVAEVLEEAESEVLRESLRQQLDSIFTEMQR